MIYFSLPPGAWPGAVGPWGAALQPHIIANADLQPHIFGRAMLQPHILAQSMLQPHIVGRSSLQPHILGKSALQPHILGRSADELDAAEREAAVAGFGWPWFGADPAWATSEPAALHALAVDKVRSRILRPEDPRLLASLKAGSPRNARPAASRSTGASRGADLWRWQGAFRIKAVVAELTARLRVTGCELHWLGDSAAGKLTAYRLIDFIPPGPGFDYSEQIDKVLRSAVERQDRLPEILCQAEEIALFFDAVTGIDRAAAPRFAEVLETAWEVTTLVVMALKNNIAELRPFQRNDSVQPLIPTPGHGALPSGHATMATVASQLLAALRYIKDAERCEQLDRLVRRIAFNRVVAGVHFPMDSYAGYELGRRLAAALVAAAEGTALPENPSVTIQFDSDLREAESLPPPLQAHPKQSVPSLQHWSMLWAAAAEELRMLRI